MTEMILAIETSAHTASCALLREGQLLASAYQNVGLTHSRTLMPMVRDMLANSALELKDCGYIAVANGPGSFTGIRIGVAAAKGIALGCGAQCIGISTLEGMAHQLAHEHAVICCAMDARRGEVYNAIFLAEGGELKRLCGDRPLPAADAARDTLEFAKNLSKNDEFPIICVGDGAELCYNLMRERPNVRLAPPHLLRQSAVGVALAAEKAARAGLACPPDELGAVYLRLSQAERERAAREAANSSNN